MRKPAHRLFLALPLALLCLGAPARAATPVTQLDALLADASRQVAAGHDPKADCDQADALLAGLEKSASINAAVVMQYQSEIAFVRATANEARQAISFKQLD